MATVTYIVDLDDNDRDPEGIKFLNTVDETADMILDEISTFARVAGVEVSR
ncbi:Uncharacterised protein [Mycobacteroides abscessus subsp. bolletii]|uniref:hypothetical protein n=1 Tax=Mycobacteroides abscessus TaxID=36809 RepID=UPI0009C7C44E|nr:hypothetical protein [Mycobacteroides abscessus]SKX79874.1 Uncharacterised protein [Mycobacteroides abscessus subsp. bolletii]SLH42331.1 Uncharacterised protein [Mycobacteroides abscessus subsp. massiliense]